MVRLEGDHEVLVVETEGVGGVDLDTGVFVPQGDVDVHHFLAALQGIPDYVYEAAKIDGASRWRTFSRVVLPLLNPTVVFLSVMGTMNALKIFGEIFVMADDGGPLNSTSSIVFQVVKTSFMSHRMGYGAAMTMVLFILIISVTVVQMKVLTRKFKY